MKVTQHQPTAGVPSGESTRFALLSPQLAPCWGVRWAGGRARAMTVPSPSLLQIHPPPPRLAERGTQRSVNPTAERRGKTWSLRELHPVDLSQRVRWPARRPAGQGVAQRQRAGVTLL